MTTDGYVNNASDYPVINWLNQLNKSVIEGYMVKRRSRQVSQSKLMPGSIEIGKK